MATSISGTGVSFGQYTSTTRPTGISQGHIIYNTDRKGLEIYDGSTWVAVTSKNSPFLYRQIIAYGYVAGGYKSSTPWRNVNKMVHSTDAMSNLGDLLQDTVAYTSGFCNRDNAFLWGAAGMGSGTYTISFNMRSDTTLTASTNHNTTVSRNDTGTPFKEHDAGYIMGGSTTIEIFNGSTETVSTATAVAPSAGGTQSAFSCISDEYKSLGGADNAANFKMDHTTVTSVTVSDFAHSFTSNAQQKGINSKLGKGWVGNEGSYNGGYNYRRWEFATETNLGTVVRGIGNSGEENFDMGQAHQYMHGCYDGAQNNRSQKFVYNTEVSTELTASGSQRSGVPGGSSGHCFWRD
jgi:hypothetical protein